MMKMKKRKRQKNLKKQNGTTKTTIKSQKDIKKCEICGAKLELVCPNDWTLRDEKTFQAGMKLGKRIAQENERRKTRKNRR
jgi:predicted  nucleic acid-binding Zn ribbon protein